MFEVDKPLENELEFIKEIFSNMHCKTRRLLDGEIFMHYDRVKLKKESIYSINKNKNKQTVKRNILFVEEWMEPDKYLSLLPVFKF